MGTWLATLNSSFHQGTTEATTSGDTTGPPRAIPAGFRSIVTHHQPMTTIHDIACPYCESVEPVVKEGLDTYRCTDCDRSFSASDIL